MKSGYFFVAVVLTCFFLFSCQREVDEILNRGSDVDSVFVDKIVSLDTSMLPGSDTVEIDVFGYDNDKRLTSIVVYFSGSPSSTDQFKFFYQGQDTVPYMHVLLSEEFGQQYTDTTYYFYSNGFVIKDSTLVWGLNPLISYGASVNSFTRSGNNLTVRSKEYDMTGGSYVLIDDTSGLFTVNAATGNITQQDLINGYNYYTSVQANYDDKKNPVAKSLKIRYPVYSSDYFDTWLLQTNNPLTIITTTDVSSPGEERFSYIYRTDGYPQQFSYWHSAGSFYNKTVYVYRSL